MSQQRRKAPPLTVPLTYETAASLHHLMLSAYVGLEEYNPKLYSEVMEQTRPFFEYLTRYLEEY